MNVLEELPAYEAHSFSKWVARAVVKYFEDPENKRRFEEWQKENAEANEEQN